jgi:hypothetical protein
MFFFEDFTIPANSGVTSEMCEAKITHGLCLDVEIGAWNSELEIYQVQFACLDGHRIRVWKAT